MIKTIVAMAAMILFTASLAACAPAAVKGINSQSRVQVAQVKAKAAVKAAQAQTNPIAHPIAATNAMVKKVETPLIFIATASIAVLGLFIGLQFTAFSFISKIGIPITAGVGITSFLGIIVLPFLPWTALALVAAIVGFIVYELVRNKGNVGNTVAAVEAEVKNLAGLAAAKA